MIPGSFSGPVRVERVWHDRDLWLLLADLAYCTQAGRVITAPAGFATDFASVPRALWWLYPPFGKGYIRPAIIHDLLYERAESFGEDGQSADRGWCDGVLREGMAVEGFRRSGRWMIWSAVRAGGWVPWRRYRQQA